ncbi:5-oxoprolinase [Kordiimonas sediminis]|uniref:5-oxoprolinase n=1 Tax=Kordiimonas sediminis TaxID=1735581 RepID=A0A919E7Y7_9PROT|nr:hydantoinase B/oxoprolinase family protein [Kordiimonas sediminis]GHF22810.1 5-oxoprolinase [Kordiimonas sediminis]
MSLKTKWQFWIDRGGTFTDIVALHPSGELTSHKYLSENPGKYQDAAVFAMREIMQVAPDAPFPASDVAAIKMGTTVATNALLERDGTPTLFLTNEGMRDVLLIGQQHRTGLFDMKPERPTPLYTNVATISARIDAVGAEVTPFDEDACQAVLEKAYKAGIRSVAIALMHSYKYPEHEQKAGAIAKNIGFTQISLSHKTSPLMKLVPRGDTTVADAYLSPVLRKYVDQVQNSVGDTRLYFMQSNGGLASANAFEGKDAVLSGPAGGIVGAVGTASREQEDKIIGFDMGGTSTDVSHYAGATERVADTVVAGVRMTVPMMDIHTVAAGGGSVCQFDQGRYLVGPASAGAFPGPAAYGRGGPVTVTDCNVILGKLQPDLFPSVFGDCGTKPLSLKAAQDAFDDIADTIETETGYRPTHFEMAEGFLAVAVEHMARAIKKISVERGHDVTRYALLTFGGAGGQHACLVADALGMTRSIVPPFSGVLSALGMGLADQSVIREQALECPLENIDTRQADTDTLTNDTVEALVAQGGTQSEIITDISLRIRYGGSDTAIAVPFGTVKEIRTAFEEAHKKQFGFTEADKPILIEAVEVEARQEQPDKALHLSADGTKTDPLEYRPVHMNGTEVNAAVYQRETLPPDHTVTGPAIILEEGGTTILEPGWSAVRTVRDTLVLERTEKKAQDQIDARTVDPVLLEVFNNLFMSVAEEMGGVLMKTAHSVNVKERLDFSCAVFDHTGSLIANAPHMPVHLGSMGDSVAAIIKARGNDIRPGNAYMVNDPYAGGTHLPDITIISPVFIGDAPAPEYFVASRGHHADIGGISPGSMSAFSKTIAEEGIRFENTLLVDGGQFCETDVRQALESGPYPARNPDQNIADLKAQIAANERGIQLVRSLVTSFGQDVVTAYMGHVQNNAEEAVRRVIDRLRDGHIRYDMDCGGTVEVHLTVDRAARSIDVDFTGTSDQMENNFNAPLAVTKAAVLYVFRLLTQADIPLNAGCMKPINLTVPKGSMLNPIEPAAVVAGNVETSQAVTNALLLATGATAASQGTMNNLTFGNARHQYYETLAGGTGAGPGFDGTDAIQSHMTNSRLTDPEILEWRFPVRVKRFEVRENSGGSGKHRGGNGAVREIEFLEAMELSILSSSRRIPPSGLAGGSPGKTGENLVLRANGQLDKLESADSTAVAPHDVLIIKTPGGGGYGS